MIPGCCITHCPFAVCVPADWMPAHSRFTVMFVGPVMRIGNLTVDLVFCMFWKMTNYDWSCSLSCLSAKWWPEFITHADTAVSSKDRNIAQPDLSIRLKMWCCDNVCRLGYTHGRGEGSSWQKEIKSFLKYKVLFHTHVQTLELHIYVHTHTQSLSMTLRCSVYLHSYRDGKHTICHITSLRL